MPKKIRVCLTCLENKNIPQNNGKHAGLSITKQGSPTYYCEDCGIDWNGSWKEVE